jgi:hypothetical protein
MFEANNDWKPFQSCFCYILVRFLGHLTEGSGQNYKVSCSELCQNIYVWMTTEVGDGDLYLR